MRPDPFDELSWPPERAAHFARRGVDELERFLAALADLPVARTWPPGAVARAAAIDIPASPMPDDELFDYVRSLMHEYSVYPGHPAFMGYITGPGTAPGGVADMLASVLAQNLGGWRLSPAATEIERRLTLWFAERLGFPDTAGGLIVSGGSMGTLTCLKVARDTRPGTRDEGLAGAPPCAVYASEEAHAVVVRSADVIGLGRRAVRRIAVDETLRMRPDALAAAIAQDRAAGVEPLVVVATAGTTGTGAIDPLADIADICERERLWMHVDGAYGAPAAMLADDLRPRFAGIERADSLAMDPHKWLYTPLPGGCAMFRDISRAFDAYNVPASYVVEDTARTGTTFDFGSHGIEWSRGFNAFRIWLSLLAFGRDAYARRISHDAALARYMGEQVSARGELELVAPVSLSICCFRYRPEGVSDEAYLNRLNERLMTEVQLDGRSYCSNAIVHGTFALRACIVNYRTEAPEVDLLLDVVEELGAKLHPE